MAGAEAHCLGLYPVGGAPVRSPGWLGAEADGLSRGYPERARQRAQLGLHPLRASPQHVRGFLVQHRQRSQRGAGGTGAGRVRCRHQLVQPGGLGSKGQDAQELHPDGNGVGALFPVRSHFRR